MIHKTHNSHSNSTENPKALENRSRELQFSITIVHAFFPLPDVTSLRFPSIGRSVLRRSEIRGTRSADPRVLTNSIRFSSYGYRYFHDTSAFSFDLLGTLFLPFGLCSMQNFFLSGSLRIGLFAGQLGRELKCKRRSPWSVASWQRAAADKI
jgi:hypothetical protein